MNISDVMHLLIMDIFLSTTANVQVALVFVEVSATFAPVLFDIRVNTKLVNDKSFISIKLVRYFENEDGTLSMLAAI